MYECLLEVHPNLADLLGPDLNIDVEDEDSYVETDETVMELHGRSDTCRTAANLLKTRGIAADPKVRT